MKCRQTGIVAEIFQRMGMQTVNLPGGEIMPSAQRGVIDCAEWVGGVEDLRLGLPQVWKYHYTPGMHESNSMLELIINSDVWKSFTPQQQEAMRAATMETFVRWGVKWQRQNADAIEEMATKHGVQLLRTPPDILVAFLKAWDDIAAEESAKNPFFKKVYEFAACVCGEGRAGQALHVPALLIRSQLLLAREDPVVGKSRRTPPNCGFRNRGAKRRPGFYFLEEDWGCRRSPRSFSRSPSGSIASPMRSAFA